MNDRTTAWLAWDEKALHIAFDCPDPEAPALGKRALWTAWGEGVEVFLYPPARGGKFHLFVSPGGTLALDGVSPEEGAALEVRAGIGEDGWTARLTLPFEVLGDRPRPETPWKICLVRVRGGGAGARALTWPRLPGLSGTLESASGSFADLNFSPGAAGREAGPEDRRITVGILPAAPGRDFYRDPDCASARGFAPPPKVDGRLRKIPPPAEIEKLIGTRRKKNGFSGMHSRDFFDRAARVIAREPWAKKAFETIRATADRLASLPDRDLYRLLPEAGQAFAYSPCYSFGCPVCGTGEADNTTSALVTSPETPDRWECVTCRRLFEPGGTVEYDPGTGPAGYRVEDDGNGWEIPAGLPGAGHRCYLRAAWRQYRLFTLLGSERARALTRTGAGPAPGGLEALAIVYALTGEEKYAHKALVLLARLAELHPRYDGLVDIGYEAMMPHVGWTTGGAEEVVDSCVLSYDIVFDHLERDGQLLDFLREQRRSEGAVPAPADAGELAREIEVNLFGYMYEWLLRVRSVSTSDDWTIWQCGQMAALGRVLENPEIVREALEGEKGFRPLLIERTLNDGRFYYNSLNYHFHKISGFGSVLLAADGYSDEEFFPAPLDLFSDSSLPWGRMLDFAEGILCCGRVPGIGDAHNLRRRIDPAAGDQPMLAHAPMLARCPQLAGLVADREGFIEKYRGSAGNALPRLALALIGLAPAVEKALSDVPFRAAGTRLFTDSGLAVLRGGREGAGQVHALLNYGVDGDGHSHHDHLALNIIAHGQELTINKGYPYSWRGGPKVHEWTQHSAAQNVVRIDGENQAAYRLLGEPLEESAGTLRAFGDNELAAFACGANERVYPGLAGRYRRTACLVKDPDNPFVVDIFEVEGGTVRDYQFHAQSDIAGDLFEVEFAGRARPARAAACPEHIDARFMRDIETAATKASFSGRWSLADPGGPGLVMEMVGSGRERTVIIGRGQGEGGDRPVPCDRHVTVRESGPGASVFMAVFFPWEGRVPAYRVTPLEAGQGIALAVEAGAREYLVGYCPDEGRRTVFRHRGVEYAFRGAGAVFGPGGMALFGGDGISRGGTVHEMPVSPPGEVVSVDMAGKSVTVKGLANLPGTPFLLKWLDRPWTCRVLSVSGPGPSATLALDTFSLLDKGRYPMVGPGDRVMPLSDFYFPSGR